MAEEPSSIWHRLHPHVLITYSDLLGFGNCKACDQHIRTDRLYSCPVKHCNFSMHKSCSEFPDSIQQHPFHPQHTLILSNDIDEYCNVCGSTCSRMLSYKCFDCSFTLHVMCASLTSTTKNNTQRDRQLNHPHPLISCDLKLNKYTFTCSCCTLPFHDDVVYVCLECQSLFHKKCAELPRELLDNTFHPSHPRLILKGQYRYDSDSKPASPRKDEYRYESDSEQPVSPRKDGCGVCGAISLRGFTYHCSECEFFMDVVCASLKPTKTITITTQNNENEKEDHQQILKFSHNKSLIFCENKQRVPIPCYACKLDLGFSVCFFPEYKFLLHKKCADLPLELDQHMFHPHHTLILHHDLSGKCEVCLCDSKGFLYECGRCDWYMDVTCALLNPQTMMMSELHPHPLALLSNSCGNFNCTGCGNSWETTTPILRCVQLCEFNIHVHCIPKLPPNLNYRNHVHTLTLTDSPIEDRPGVQEFYCDACEQKRVQRHPTYYCQGCQYIAHPHCMLTEIKYILKAEWSKQESNGRANQNKESSSLTVEEFFNSFNEDENEEVFGVFDAYIRDSQEDSGDNPKYSIHLGDTFTQFMKILVSKNQVITKPWEKWNLTSTVIEVDDFMILENLVPILEALLGKYRNFSDKSKLSQKAKMIYMIVVCDAIHSMCSTMVMEINTNLLLSWFQSFMLGQYAGFEIQFAFGRLKRVACSYFVLQPDAPTDDTLAKLDEEIAEQYTLVNSEELTSLEQEKEIEKLWERIASLQLASTKLHKRIENRYRKIRTLKNLLEEKRAISKFREECLNDAPEPEGEIAGTGLL